jgi:leader peptidase (prepilin peptidase) / N-methyltransferase
VPAVPPVLIRVVVSTLAAVAASPVLASWSLRAADRDLSRWWTPARVSARRWAVVAVVATVLGVLAALADPWPAWWLYAEGGTVLAVVDVQHHRLPSRLVYPLAVAELLILAGYAAEAGELHLLLRAAAAAAVVGGCWFTCAFVVPGALGLGDVRVASLSAALLGWHSWQRVIDGQFAILLLSLVTAAAVALARPDRRGRRMAVPMGPALLAGTVLLGLR